MELGLYGICVRLFQFKSVYKDEEEPEILDPDVLMQHITTEGMQR